jgi:hypothetical protein
VRDFSRRIRIAFTGVRNTVSVFRTLCTLTRIETSRLGNTTADFGDLAADVLPLSESIQRSGEGVLEAAARLDESVQGAIARGAELRRSQTEQLPGLISGINQGLQAFEERRRRALETSGHQASEYKALAGAMDNVVSSIQFHDITRQQVENVLHALRPLASVRDAKRSASGETRALLTLQAAQLARAAEIFASSVERMEADLDSVSTRGQSMAEGCRNLMGDSTDENGSFFVRMEGRFTAILNLLGKCTQAQSEMEDTAGTLRETIDKMRTSVSEIRNVELGIQRIAINATIRATHIGPAGDALNVIAEVMQRLALDSNSHTEAVHEALDAMSDAVNCAAGGTCEETAAARAGADRAIEEMRSRVLEMHASSESTFSRVEQIAVLSARLASEIATLRAGFTAGRVFAEVVAGARRELERVGERGGIEHGGIEHGETAAMAQSRHLENLVETYTMQTQRDVHESVVRGAERIAQSGAGVEILEDGDLGGNVELF